MDLKELENLAVSSTGLVPMRITVPNFSPYAKGSVHGFPPKMALKLIGNGQAELLDADMQARASKAAATEKQSPVITSRSVNPDDPGKVDIPADWETFNPVKKIALAKRLDPNFKPPDNVKPGEHAITVINAAVESRKLKA
jgi:hypothetical protein